MGNPSRQSAHELTAIGSFEFRWKRFGPKVLQENHPCGPGHIFVGIFIFSHLLLSHGWRLDPCGLLRTPARRVLRRMGNRAFGTARSLSRYFVSAVKLPTRRVELPGDVKTFIESGFLPAHKAGHPADWPARQTKVPPCLHRSACPPQGFWRWGYAQAGTGFLRRPHRPVRLSFFYL